MVTKKGSNNTNKEAIRVVLHIKKEKDKLLNLPYLCLVLMGIEAIVDMYIHVLSLIIATFIFVNIVYIYISNKLKVYKNNLSNILSAVKNGMTLREWKNITKNQLMGSDLKVVKISWRSLNKDCGVLTFSYLLCMSITFGSFLSS